MFFKLGKKHQKQLEKHYIPAEDMEMILSYVDNINGGRQVKLNRYNLWKSIRIIFPDLDFENAQWSLIFPNATSAYIAKTKKK